MGAGARWPLAEKPSSVWGVRLEENYSIGTSLKPRTEVSEILFSVPTDSRLDKITKCETRNVYSLLKGCRRIWCRDGWGKKGRPRDTDHLLPIHMQSGGQRSRAGRPASLRLGAEFRKSLANPRMDAP